MKRDADVDGSMEWFELKDLDALARHFAKTRVVGREAAWRMSEEPISLPLPGGRQVDVKLHAYVGMEDGDKVVPDLATYMLRGVDDPRLRGSLTFANGRVYASLNSPLLFDGETVLIDPVSWHARGAGDTATYVVFRKSHYRRAMGGDTGMPACLQDEPKVARRQATVVGAKTFGSNKYSLRLALSATVQYAQHFSSATPGSPAFAMEVTTAMVVTMNRVNEVFLVTVASAMTLIPGNEALISTSASDLISQYNNDVTGLRNQNPTWILTVKSVAGSAFDIGHVFSTGNGGMGNFLSVCNSDPIEKALGATGRSVPSGDPFDIDYVAHEMGHQFNAEHTYNMCSGWTNVDSGVEPGSAITIMGYAGLCGSNNLASNSIASFAWFSFLQMNNLLTLQCASRASSNAGGVTITSKSPDMTIPHMTAFFLEMTATTTTAGQENALTYSFEEADVGPGRNMASGDGGTNPLFRTYLPTQFPHRFIIPNSAVGMLLPTTNRDINMVGMVYDNAPSGGHVSVSDFIVVTVDNSKGPFSLTGPVVNANVSVGIPFTVQWTVASTDALSSTVNVYVVDSEDQTGGIGVLVTNVVNNGSASITLPPVAAGTAKIRLQGVINTFFSQRDINVLPSIVTTTGGTSTSGDGTSTSGDGTSTGGDGTSTTSQGSSDVDSSANTLDFVL